VGNLGEAFPDSFREEHSHRALAVGSVIRCRVTDTKSWDGSAKPKIKYWAVVGINHARGELATVYINTRIISLIRNDTELLKAQFVIKPDERNIVDHECYADCSALFVKDIEYFQELLANNPGYSKGELTPDELANMLRLLRNASTVSPIDKKRFGIL